MALTPSAGWNSPNKVYLQCERGFKIKAIADGMVACGMSDALASFRKL
jgi:hypothetical protein